MVLEVTGIVCATVAFLWAFTITLAGITSVRLSKQPQPNLPSLDEVFAQAKQFIDGFDNQ